MNVDPVALALLVAAMAGAAFINGVIGFGYALLAVNVLALILGAKTGIIVLSLLTPFVSGLQIWRHRAHRRTARRLRSLVITAAVGTVVGTQILVLLPAELITVALGLLTVGYVLRELRGRRPPIASSTERRLGPIAGLVGGVSNGALGASGPVLGSYLVAIGLRGGEFVLGISLVFFTMSLVRNVVLAGLGQYSGPVVLVALVVLGPSLVAQVVGFWFRDRLPAAALERAVLVVLLIASLDLLGGGVSAILSGH